MKLTNRNYFSKKANREYMSVSQFKSFETCPECAMAEINGKWERPKTAALLVGSYVDAYFEGRLDIFVKKHPECFKRDGSLKNEYVQANAIIARIESDKLMTEYLTGRKQVIMEGVIEGVKVKIKVDVLGDGRICDLKIMRDFNSVYVEEHGRLPWYEAWRYDLQGAVYQEIVRQNTGEKLPFYLVAATKEPVTDIGIWHISQNLMDFELEKFREKLPVYDAMKKKIVDTYRCERCDYCRSTKVLTEPNECEGEFEI